MRLGSLRHTMRMRETSFSVMYTFSLNRERLKHKVVWCDESGWIMLKRLCTGGSIIDIVVALSELQNEEYRQNWQPAFLLLGLLY